MLIKTVAWLAVSVIHIYSNSGRMETTRSFWKLITYSKSLWNLWLM